MPVSVTLQRPWRVATLIAVAIVATGRAALADPILIPLGPDGGTTAPTVVMILDAQAPGIESKVAESIPGAIAQLFSPHLEYQLVPDGEMHGFMHAYPDCAQTHSCIEPLASALHAQLVVTAQLEKFKSQYVLTVGVATKGDLAHPKTATETMKRLSNLPLNVALCLSRLLNWPAPAGAE